MAFIPGNTGTASSFPDGFTGSSLANVETITVTRVLTSADRRTQILTPSGAVRIAQLPATAIIGEEWILVCATGSSFSLQINSSNGSQLALIVPGQSITINATSATPTTPSNWSIQSGGGGLDPVEVSSTVALAANRTQYLCNTSGGAFSITLPTGASKTTIGIADARDTFGTNNLTVIPATGQAIDGLAVNETLVLDVSGSWVTLTWSVADSRWVIQSSAPGSSNQAIVQNGNVLGTAMTIGTNDNFGFNIETNGTVKVAVGTAGDVTLGPTSSFSGLTHNVYSGTTRYNIQAVGGTAYLLGTPPGNGAASNLASFGVGEGDSGNFRTGILFSQSWSGSFTNHSLSFQTHVGGTGDVAAGSISAAGAWTLGPSAANAINHTLRGSIILTTAPSNTFSSASYKSIGSTASQVLFSDGQTTQKEIYFFGGGYYNGTSHYASLNNNNPIRVSASACAAGTDTAFRVDRMRNGVTDYTSTAQTTTLDTVVPLMAVRSDGIVNMFAYANGTLSFTGSNGTISTSSDARLKTLVEKPIPGLAQVLALEPKFFTWKEEQEKKENPDIHLGFFAQDVLPVIPEAVGQPITADGYYGLYDRPIIAALVKAIQELHTEIQLLKGGN